MANRDITTNTRLRLITPERSDTRIPDDRPTVVHALGGSGDAVRAASVIAAVEQVGLFRQLVVHSGTGGDPGAGGVLLRDLEMPVPRHHLCAPVEAGAARMAALLNGFEEILALESPDLVVVYGAGNTALAASLAAGKQDVALAHVEAGLRSGGPHPSLDLNRILIDRLADTLLAASSSAGANLLVEGVPDTRVHVVGSTSIDTLRRHESKALHRSVWTAWGLERGRYVLVALTSRDNIERGAAELDGAVAELAGRESVAFCTPPWGTAHLEASGRRATLEAAGVRCGDPEGYIDFLSLLAGAGAVVTDSGSVQDEACALGVHCNTIGAHTDRPAALERGMNILLGDDPLALAAVTPGVAGPTPGAVPLWDGRASERAASVIAANYAIRTH